MSGHGFDAGKVRDELRVHVRDCLITTASPEISRFAVAHEQGSDVAVVMLTFRVTRPTAADVASGCDPDEPRFTSI